MGSAWASLTGTPPPDAPADPYGAGSAWVPSGVGSVYWENNATAAMIAALQPLAYATSTTGTSTYTSYTGYSTTTSTSTGTSTTTGTGTTTPPPPPPPPIAGPPTPGILRQGTVTGPASAIDLWSLIGGPATPAQVAGPGLSSTGMGFPGGGTVSLADVAGQFALGGVIRTYSPLGLPQGLVSSLVRAGQGDQGTPRTVSSPVGDRIGVKVGNLTINNPVAERPSDSITRSSNRLAFLAGRGPV